MSAQTHLIGGWLGAAENSVLTNRGTSLGVSGELGLTYSIHHKHFLFNTGVGISDGGTWFTVADDHHEMPGSVDRDGYEFTFVYDVAGRKDKVNLLSLSVPLRLGAYFEPVYFLAGARLSLPFVANGGVSADVSTYGDYPHFLDPFTGMPEHQYFLATEMRWNDPVKALTDVLLSGEIGYALTSASRPMVFTVGLYAEYGVLRSFSPVGSGAQADGNRPLMQYPDVFTDSDMLSPLQPANTLNTVVRANTLNVGIRLSLLFVKKQKPRRPPYPCHCNPFS